MFQTHSNQGYKHLLDGVEMRTLAYGEKTMLVEFRFVAGSRLPFHSHPHEQTGYLISGRGRLSVAGVPHEIRPGDSWNIPGSTEHGAEFDEASVVIEVFSPVREDYLPVK
jgi:quercetin dioxygenase-like cupin family protein